MRTWIAFDRAQHLCIGFVLGLSIVSCQPAKPPVVTPPIVTPPAQPEQPPAPVVLPLHNEHGFFADANGQRWYWRGASDFQLLKFELEGTPYDQILDQRQQAGANLVRVFGMAHNLFDLVPNHYDFYAGVDRLLTKLAARGMYLELTVFADAQLVMPATSDQRAHWDGFRRFSGRANLLLELVNENSHAGNTIDVQAFPFLDGILCSHGSNQTDEHPIEPYWNWVTYHARRDGIKGATNYDSREFEAADHDRPWIADEGAKFTDVRLAMYAGMEAKISGGGSFHSQSGVTSQVWTAEEAAAATAFFKEIR